MLGKSAFALVFLSACGSSFHDPNYTDVGDRPINPTPTPTASPSPGANPLQRIQYRPAWLSKEWSDSAFFITGGEYGNWGILPGEEPIANSMYHFWESVRGSWTKTLNHGYVPTDYLERLPSGFDHIVWTDKTKGSIQGFEKLKATLLEMRNRCPLLADKSLQAPLEVAWATENDITAPGQFFGNNPTLRWEVDRISFTANLLVRPTLNVRAEWIKTYADGHEDGWRWPLQTFKEQTNGKSWADGGTALFSIDETFSHEYGHFLIQGWALNHGRNTLQTQWFAESWAETFRAVCWGDFRDNLEWSKTEILFKSGSGIDTWIKTYTEWNHRFQNGDEYTLGSIGDVISYKMSRGEYIPSEVFNAMLKTLSNMEGVIVPAYPVKSTYDKSMLFQAAPWTGTDPMPFALSDAPRLFTRQEFLQKFCGNYDCGPMKQLVEAEAKGLEKDEW